MVVISGSARNQSSWWKKNQPTHSKKESVPKRGGDNNEAHSAMEAKNYMDNFEVLKQGVSQVVCDQVKGQSSAFSGRQVLKHTKRRLEVRSDEEVVGLSLQDKCTRSCKRRSESPPHKTTAPLSPRLSPNSNTQLSIRTWKRLAHELGNTNPNYTPMVVDRRPSIEIIDLREGKKSMFDRL